MILKCEISLQNQKGRSTMQDKSLMFYMIRSELEDAVGVENVSTKEIERAVYSVDYFWLSRKWQDAGEQGPMPDIIVRPGTTEEVSKVMKIANYYKIPVTTWGGGSGSQGGALPVAGGILLDIKRLDKLIELNTEAGFVTCETGMIFATPSGYMPKAICWRCKAITTCPKSSVWKALRRRAISTRCIWTAAVWRGRRSCAFRWIMTASAKSPT